jgi:hypothetical protein
LSPQRESIKPLVVAKVAKYRRDGSHTATIKLASLRTVDGVLHALGKPQWRGLVIFKDRDLTYRRALGMTQALGPKRTRATVSLGASEFLICPPIGSTVIPIALELLAGWTDAGIGHSIMNEIPRTKALD